MTVYLLQAGDRFKIGIASDPNQRLRLYQTESPFQIVVLGIWEQDDAPELERILLRRYRRRLVKGREWLALRPRDIWRICRYMDGLK